MNRISSKTHAVLDYLSVPFLVFCPWIFNLGLTKIEGQIFIFAAITILIYTIITKYEYGLINIISLRLHLMLDGFLGLFLAMSPWIFSFSERVHLPHLLIGFCIFTIAVFTKTKPWL